MPHDFVPRRDGDFAPWIARFTATLVADPERYGQSEATVDELVELQAAFASAYVAAASIATRTRAAVAQKDATRAAVERLARRIACHVKTMSALPMSEKLALGLSAPGAFSRPSAAPPDPPAVAVLSAVGNRVTLRISDPAAPSRVARPKGVMHAMIRWAVGTHPPRATDEYRGLKQTGRTTVQVVFPADLPPGTRGWVIVNWLGHDHKPGPASQPVGMDLTPTGGVLAPTRALRGAA